MLHGGEGGDTAWLTRHGIPGVLTGVEDVGVGWEDEVTEEVVLEVLPGFFSGIALRRVRR
jgi:hypothetical protein